MIKYIKFNIVFLLITFPLDAQFGFSGSFGFGSYEMNTLKDLNKFNRIINTDRKILQLEQLENFPVYQNFSIDGFYDYPSNLRVSAGIKYYTTGSRLYLEDYSGKINYDIITNAYVLHLSLSLPIFKIPLLQSGLFFDPQILFCNTNFKYKIQLYPDYNDSDITEGTALNLGASAGLFIRKRFNRFEGSFEAGYHYDILKGTLMTEFEGDEYEMHNQETNTPLRNNWSGIRVSVGLGYFL